MSEARAPGAQPGSERLGVGWTVDLPAGPPATGTLDEGGGPGRRLRGPALTTGEERIDPWALAVVLVPGLARGERAKLAAVFDLPLPSREPDAPAALYAEHERILTRCRERLLALDLDTLQRLARIFAGSRLPEAREFEAAFRQRAQQAFTSTLGGTTAGSGSGATPGEPEAGLWSSETELPLDPPPPPLQPTRRRTAVDQQQVLRDFAPDGAIAAGLPGYELRPGQLKLARAVAKALSDQLHLITEAGTGTGKSLAYLLPAVHYAVANGRRVVVSTNTINLQDQLYFKDIPMLRRALTVPFQATVLKGRSNYLCLRRWRGFLRDGLQSDADRLLAAKLLLWLRETRTGDRNELVLDEREAVRWATSLAADAVHCTPQLCRDHRIGRCFLSRARRRAEGAHILVVNHALLLADQALESKVLPDYADLVLDEAHHLEEVATRQLGVAVDQQELLNFLASVSQSQGPGRYAGLVARAHAALINAGGPPMRTQAGELVQPAHDAADGARRSLLELFDAVADFVRQCAELSARAGEGEGPSRRWGTRAGAEGGASGLGERELRLTPALRQGERWTAVEVAAQGLGETLSVAESALARIVDALEPFQGSAEVVDDTLVDLDATRRQLTEVRIHLATMVAEPRTDEVYWIAQRERGIALHAAPLEVGARLQQHLFSQKDSVVLTSATVQVGGSFRYIRERLGLPPSTFTLAVPSPFDYRAQALLCVPHDLPDPTSRGFAEAVHQALLSICQAMDGRTLVLFTSHAALRAAHEHLTRRLPRLTILGQGLDGSRQQLLERFRQTPDTVLLGTSSFWEGIDVVGEALSCLVIVKLPFSVPNDPVFAARSELYADPFMEYALPQAVLRLRQGFGRLIRSGRDRGVVAVLDSRLWTKRYGSVFLRSLPPATQRRCSWQEVAHLTRAWLEAGHAPPPPRS